MSVRAAVKLEKKRAGLGLVLSSETFARSEQLRNFLRFLSLCIVYIGLIGYILNFNVLGIRS